MNGSKVVDFGLFGKDGHLTPKALALLKEGRLSDEEMAMALSHIGSCEACAEAFASDFTEEELLEVPHDFETELQDKIKQIETDKKRGFTLYVLRVAIAACAAIAITFSGTLNQLSGKPKIGSKIKAPDLSFVNTINQQLKDFSQNILNMEVWINAAKKK
ncbi:hypothetical protein CCDG5_0258 [[Clostridium] cellulosi]|jgi:hypothetical protein|uniref:Zinc-finger domain-containing protein n=1 Tax=[Clostridium] cellulosi TaxID=29343 RepID=A0A078KIN4_9FIRM|nr:hypothetical protein CCDG5_0258 [[Clostridium] cellulosi]